MAKGSVHQRLLRPKIKEKLEALDNYSSRDSVLVSFGPKEYEGLNAEYDNIIYKSIEDVFKDMNKDPVGHEIVSNMLNVRK